MMMRSRFVIYKDIAGYYRWYLQATNGEKVASSEAYLLKQSAIDSANWIKKIAWSMDVVSTI